MLDVTIIRNSDGSLDFDVYRKPTHTNQYIAFTSHQPLSHKLSTIHSLTRRAALIPSTDELKEAELKRVKEALTLNGYPKWAYDRGRYRVLPPLPLPPPPPPSLPGEPTTSGTPPPPPPTTTAKKRLGNVNLPFLSGVTEPLARLLNTKGLSTSVTTRGSVRETLVKPKDKLEKEQSVGHIYHIPCAGAHSTPCPGRYIGETERTAHARFQEHTSTATNALGNYMSAMLQHARENQHHFRKEDMTILSSENDWVKRGIREAIFIKTLKPSINIDPGRHTLSSHFDSILGSIISAPPAPATHSADENLINTAPRRQGRPRKQPNNETAAKTVVEAAHSETVAKTVVETASTIQQQQPPRQQRQSQ